MLANLTVAYVKLHGPTTATSGANSMTFNQVSKVVYLSGSTGGVIDSQTFNGAPSDALICAYLSNGTRMYTKLIGTSTSDYGYYVTSYSTGAIHTGLWQSSNAFVEYRLLNGSVGWQILQVTASCQASYLAVYYN